MFTEGCEELDEDAAVGFPGRSSAGGQAVSAWLMVWTPASLKGPRERHFRCGPMIVEDSPPLTLNRKTFSQVGHYSHPDCATESHSDVSDSL